MTAEQLTALAAQVEQCLAATSEICDATWASVERLKNLQVLIDAESERLKKEHKVAERQRDYCRAIMNAAYELAREAKAVDEGESWKPPGWELSSDDDDLHHEGEE